MATSPDNHEIWTEEKNGQEKIFLRFGVGEQSATIEFAVDEAQQLAEDLLAAVRSTI